MRQLFKPFVCGGTADIVSPSRNIVSPELGGPQRQGRDWALIDPLSPSVQTRELGAQDPGQAPIEIVVPQSAPILTKPSAQQMEPSESSRIELGATSDFVDIDLSSPSRVERAPLTQEPTQPVASQRATHAARIQSAFRKARRWIQRRRGR